jgi:ABC-type transporter Mla subunit MlaD
MQIDKKIDVNDSLRSKAEIAGIAGGKFIQLYYPTDPQMAKLHPKITFEPPYKMIKSSPSGIEEIELAMRDVINNLRLLKVQEISEETINFLKSSSSFFQNPEIFEIIGNLKKSSSSLNDILVRADTSKILDFIANSSSQLYQTTLELKLFADNLNKQVEDLNLPDYLKNAYLQYDSTLTNIRKVFFILGSRSENLIYNFSETLDEIKSTNKQLRKSLRAISENPSQVFFSEPPEAEK